MKDHRSPQNPEGFFPQPPSSADWQRYPPKGESCERARRLMRDYVENELPAADRGRLEAHVHDCKDCGRALSWAEFESRSIGEALRVPGELLAEGLLGPSEDFGAKVMARVDVDGERQHHLPRRESCERACRMMRDYVDNELPAEDRKGLEAHVHECKDCGRALSQAEFELLHIREALRVPGGLLAEGKLGPSEHFGAKVMARVHGELQRQSEQNPPEDFTEGVMERFRRENAQRQDRRTAWVRLVAATVLFAASLVLFLAAWPEEADAGVRVLSATDSFVKDGDQETGLKPGLVLPGGQKVRTGSNGSAQLAWPADSSLSEDGGVEVEPGSEVRVGEDTLWLDRGSVFLSSDVDSKIVLPDGTAVRMSAGRYRLSVDALRGMDKEVLGTRQDMQAKLEVEKGEAEIWRAGRAHAVGPGRVARFGSRLAVDLDAAVDTAMLERARQRAAELERTGADTRSDEEGQRWLAAMLDSMSHQPLAGMHVRLMTSSGVFEGMTDGLGRIPLVGDLANLDMENLRDQFLVLEARTPGAGLPYVFGPYPMPFRVPEVGEQPASFLVGRARRLRGQVEARDNRSLEGMVLLPCLVDDAMGVVQPLIDYKVVLGVDGMFHIYGLPPALGPQQSLALIACGAGRLPFVCYVSTARTQQAPELAMRVRLPAMVRREYNGLPAGRQRVLCEAHGLPVLVGRQRVRSDARGVMTLRVPRGYRGGIWRAQRSGLPVPVGKTRPAPVELDQAELGREAPFHLLRRHLGERFQSVVEMPVPGRSGGFVSVHDSRREPVAGTQIFAKLRGRWRFLGIFNGGKALSIGISSDQPLDLLAIAPDGSVGRVAYAANQRPMVLEVLVLRPGVIRLLPNVVQLLQSTGGLLHLEDKDGFRFSRVASEGVPLMPGTYRVGVGRRRPVSLVVRPGGETVIER